MDRRARDENLTSAEEPEASPSKLEVSIIEDTSAPGGFIVDDTAPGGFIVDDSAGGGFIPESTSTTDEDDPTNSNRIDHIPFAVIPSALQLLDLQPDDDDVLSVFRNAATGWENKHASRANEHGDSHLLVSRKDWRAVCAALMDVTTGDDEDEDRDGDEDVEMRDDDDGDMAGNESGEEYVESGDDSDFGEEDDDSDDEYTEGGFVRAKSQRQTSDSPLKSRKRRGVTSTSLSPVNSSDEDEFEKTPQRITARQKAESRRAFTLFFPDVPDEDLDKQKIMIKDIARVSALLKEKLTAEEVCHNSYHPLFLLTQLSVDCGDVEGLLYIS